MTQRLFALTLLSDWASYGSTDAAYRENQTALERILGLTVSVQAFETIAVLPHERILPHA